MAACESMHAVMMQKVVIWQHPEEEAGQTIPFSN
jgi:hypothetical protein